MEKGTPSKSQETPSAPAHFVTMRTIAPSPPRTRIMPAIVAVIAFAIFQVAVTILPSIGVGEAIGSQSAAVRTLITPAGWAFSIWGLLYAGAFLFAAYQALPAQTDNRLVARLRWPAAGAFAGNAVWAAYVQFAGLSAVSVVVIIWTLLCVLTAFSRIAAWGTSYTTGERWCAVVPLSALAAWLTVATTVNIAASLRFHGVESGNATPLVSATIIVVAGAVAGAALLCGRGNPAYAAVILWALSAIYAAGGSQADLVAAAAVVAALLVLLGAITGWRRRPGS